MTARNSVGTSTESEILTVLGAKVPDAPINLQNVPSITADPPLKAGASQVNPIYVADVTETSFDSDVGLSGS